MTCVLCRSNAVGTIGKKRYFCSNCCIEFVIGADTKESIIFSVSEEGIAIQEGRGYVKGTEFEWNRSD